MSPRTDPAAPGPKAYRPRVAAADLWGEAWRNLTSGVCRAVVLGAVLTAVAGALGGARIVTWLETQRQAQAFLEAGAATHILEAPGAIDGIDNSTAISAPSSSARSTAPSGP